VSAGFAHSCAVRTDGTAVCWGSDDSDQLDAPTDRMVSVSAGYNHTCGLTPDGHAVCWGHDAYGESTVPRDTFLALAAGYLTTCGLRPDSTITCWGYETWETPLAEPPGPVGRWTVASGAKHSCAVSNDSLLYCWGANDVGQATPPAVPGASEHRGCRHCALTWTGSRGAGVPPSRAHLPRPPFASSPPARRSLRHRRGRQPRLLGQRRRRPHHATRGHLRRSRGVTRSAVPSPRTARSPAGAPTMPAGTPPAGRT